MGERAIIERGMESLERIGQGDSSTFIIPQELTSLVGRYGGHLSGSDSQPAAAALESREFDEETRSLLGLDNIDELLANLTEIDHSNIDAEVDDSDEERDLEPDVEMG
jgi:hypothetical protein